jgi:hypothetical protein
MTASAPAAGVTVAQLAAVYVAAYTADLRRAQNAG